MHKPTCPHICVDTHAHTFICTYSHAHAHTHICVLTSTPLPPQQGEVKGLCPPACRKTPVSGFRNKSQSSLGCGDRDTEHLSRQGSNGSLALWFPTQSRRPWGLGGEYGDS